MKKVSGKIQAQTEATAGKPPERNYLKEVTKKVALLYLFLEKFWELSLVFLGIGHTNVFAVVFSRACVRVVN